MTSREQESADSRWAEYQNMGTLRNHWYWRPGWAPGRTFYTWHLTFERQLDVHDLVTAVQREIDLPGLDLVPLTGLHLTMQGVGFTDEVTKSDLLAIVDAAQRECQQIAPFDLHLGPVDPDAEGVGLLVRPWQAVFDVRAAVRAAIANVWPTVPEPEHGFRPHVTVAYTGADIPTEKIISKLTPLRVLPPATARVSTVRLIALRRDQRTYEWETVQAVQLGSR